MDDLVDSLDECYEGLLGALREVVALAKGTGGSKDTCRVKVATQLSELIEATCDYEDTAGCEELMEVVESFKQHGRQIIQKVDQGGDNVNAELGVLMKELGQDLKNLYAQIEKLKARGKGTTTITSTVSPMPSSSSISKEPPTMDAKALEELKVQTKAVLLSFNTAYKEANKQEADKHWAELLSILRQVVPLGEITGMNVKELIREPFEKIVGSVKLPQSSWPSNGAMITDIQNLYGALRKVIEAAIKKVAPRSRASSSGGSRSKISRTDSTRAFASELQGLNISDQDPSLIFNMVACIGKGAAGEVWKATKVGAEPTDPSLAIKKVKLALKTLNATVREIATMKKIQHPNTLQYYNCFKHDDYVWIVMEFCELGSIQGILEKKGASGLDEAFIAVITFQVLEGLAYLHSQSFIHRDIKAGNLLMRDDGTVKIADFGTSASAIYLRTTVIGSSYWMAPETIVATGHDSKADIWSFGCTLLEMAEKDPPFFSEKQVMVGQAILTRPAPTFKDPRKWSENFRQFLGFCLVKRPELRKSAVDLLKEPWITERDQRALAVFIKDPVNAVWDPEKATGEVASPQKTLSKTKSPREDQEVPTIKIFLPDLRSGQRFSVTPEETTVQLSARCKQSFRNHMDAGQDYAIFIVLPTGETQLRAEHIPWVLYLQARKKYKRGEFKFVWKPSK